MLPLGLLLPLLPGGIRAVQQSMSIDTLASNGGDAPSLGGTTGSRQPVGVTHSAQLAQTLLRLLAAMYSWSSCDAQERPDIDASATQRLVEYLHGLLSVGPITKLMTKKSPYEVCKFELLGKCVPCDALPEPFYPETLQESTSLPTTLCEYAFFHHRHCTWMIVNKPAFSGGLFPPLFVEPWSGVGQEKVSPAVSSIAHVSPDRTTSGTSKVPAKSKDTSAPVTEREPASTKGGSKVAKSGKQVTPPPEPFVPPPPPLVAPFPWSVHQGAVECLLVRRSTCHCSTPPFQTLCKECVDGN